jgi:hypothetical protein
LVFLAINLVLLFLAFAAGRSSVAQGTAPVPRARTLELVDAAMKRASFAFGATELRRYDMPDGNIMHAHETL